VDEQEIAGAVTVIGRKEGILSHEAVGSLSLEKSQPLSRDALFRIASMTKPITAIAIMMLVEQGKLSLDDPVERHLPEFRGQMLVAGRSEDAVTLKKPPRLITVRDLLTHTSGLSGRYPEGLTGRPKLTLAEAILAQSQRPLDFEPGSKWAYCNPGIDALGRLIEVLSGQSFADFLQQRLFHLLEMVDTTFSPSPAQLERVATLYGKKDGKLVPAANPLASLIERYPSPAGGLYSTGADLAKLYQMMLGRGSRGTTRILSPESVTTMTRVQTGDLTTGFTPGMAFGLGWGVVRAPTGVTAMLSPGTYGHGGAFGTQGWIDPRQDLFFILLIQRVGLPNSDASRIREEFQALAVAALKK
jgi:CubicO group peptidase (beta-lactamase class C family)